jgi:ribosomal protein S18 acetylase RimI-like enzyme
MPTLAFAAKPAALRCARCGRFVDWAEAQLQTVCPCRPHLSLPPVLVRQAEPEDTLGAMALFRRDFGRSMVIGFGESMAIEDCPMLVAEMRGELAGALAYRLVPDALHIVALATDPMWQRSGVATHLEGEATFIAQRHGVRRLLFATTNDNIPALYFYQRRGWTITEVVPGGMLQHFGGQPGVGFAGIPVRDEVRLKKVLTD